MSDTNTDDTTIDIRHLCPLPHRGNAAQIHPPATMCDSHHRQLPERLTDIRRLWAVLDELALSARDGNGQTGSKSQAPTQLDIVALTDWHTADTGDVPAATRWLTDFAYWVSSVRHLNRPMGTHGAITMLLVHHTALVDYDPADVLWHRVKRVWLYLRRIAGENRHVLGYCQEPHPDDPEAECGGAMFHTPNSARPVVCSTCGDTWSDTAVRIAIDQMNLTIQREADSA